MTAAEQLRTLVKEAMRTFAWRYSIDENRASQNSRRWIEEHALELAELVADMGEALEKIAAIGDDTCGWAGREAGSVARGALRRLDALFSEKESE